MDTEIRLRVSKKKLTLEKKIIPPFLQELEPTTFQSQVQHNHWTSPVLANTANIILSVSTMLLSNSVLLLLTEALLPLDSTSTEHSCCIVRMWKQQTFAWKNARKSGFVAWRAWPWQQRRWWWFWLWSSELKWWRRWRNLESVNEQYDSFSHWLWRHWSALHSWVDYAVIKVDSMEFELERECGRVYIENNGWLNLGDDFLDQNDILEYQIWCKSD